MREEENQRQEQEKSGVLKEDHLWSLYLRPGLLGLGLQCPDGHRITQDDLTEKSGFEGT